MNTGKREQSENKAKTEHKINTLQFEREGQKQDKNSLLLLNYEVFDVKHYNWTSENIITLKKKITPLRNFSIHD